MQVSSAANDVTCNGCVLTGTGTPEHVLTSQLSQQPQQRKQEHEVGASLYYSSADTGKSSFYQSLLSPPSMSSASLSTRQQLPIAETRADVAAASTVCQASGFVHHHQPSILDVIISSPHQLSTPAEPQEALKMEMKQELDDEATGEVRLAAELEELETSSLFDVDQPPTMTTASELGPFQQTSVWQAQPSHIPFDFGTQPLPVSYTHLTLPTILRV